jgi:hypothetical protein
MHAVLHLASLGVALLSLAAALYLIRKAKWIIATADRHKRSADHQMLHLFRHVQILQALHEDLKLPHRLPPTGGKAASPDFLKMVSDHVLAAKPMIVVECGSGISTIVIARCLQIIGAGHVFSMEHMPRFADATRAELRRQGVIAFATVLDAPLVDQQYDGRVFQWYQTEGLPKAAIDLLIVDGPPARTGISPRYPAGPKLFPLLAAQGAVFIDDAKRPEERDVIQEWRRQFPDLEFEIDTENFHKGICIAQRIAAQSSGAA